MVVVVYTYTQPTKECMHSRAHIIHMCPITGLHDLVLERSLIEDMVETRTRVLLL